MIKPWCMTYEPGTWKGIRISNEILFKYKKTGCFKEAAGFLLSRKQGGPYGTAYYQPAMEIP
jgi:hypothetical protein